MEYSRTSAGLTECGSHWAFVSLLQTGPFLSVLWYIWNANCAPIFTLLCTVNIGVMALFCLRLSSFVFRFVSSLLSCFLLLSRHFHFLPKFVFPYYTVLKTEVYCLLFMKWIYFNAIYYSLISEVALNDCEIQKHFSKFTSYLWEVKNWTNDLRVYFYVLYFTTLSLI